MTDTLTPAQEFESPADALAHYGKKGMKWGVTNAPGTSNSRRAAVKELRSVGKSARQSIKGAKKAKTQDERNAAADRYQKEVVNKIKSPEFKAAYKKANTVTKGQMAAIYLTQGPVGLVTIAAVQAEAKNIRQYGQAQELAVSKQILGEMRKAG